MIFRCGDSQCCKTLSNRGPPPDPLHIQPCQSSTCRLPPSLPTPAYDTWSATRRNYLIVYRMAYQAERYAETKLLRQEAKKNAMFARVAGYLLVELFDRRAVLTETPCVSLAKQLTSPHRNGGTTHDVVFQVDKLLRDHLLRMCTFDFGLSYGVRCLSFLVVRTSPTPYPAPTLHPPRPSFDRLVDAAKGSMEVDSKSYASVRREVCTYLTLRLLPSSCLASSLSVTDLCACWERYLTNTHVRAGQRYTRNIFRTALRQPPSRRATFWARRQCRALILPGVVGQGLYQTRYVLLLRLGSFIISVTHTHHPDGFRCHRHGCSQRLRT